MYGYCEKCNTYSKNYKGKVCIPDPIDTSDWNLAMKYRDRAIKKYGEDEFLATLIISYYYWFNNTPGTRKYNFKNWLACYVTPQDIFKACMLLEVEQKTTVKIVDIRVSNDTDTTIEGTRP